MAVDNSAWDGPAAMSRATESEDPAAAYEAICAGRKNGDPELQSSWALPHHKNPGDAANADGVRNALSRLPQTEGLTNAEAAQSHLESHMADVRSEASAEEPQTLTAPIHWTLNVDEPLTMLSTEQRILGLRLLTYNKVIDSRYGPLMFEPGAFGQVDAKTVRLRMDHENPPTGIGVKFTETPDAPLMDFRVSKTQRGDDQLALAVDGVSRGVSVGFDHEPQSVMRRIGNQHVTVFPPNSATLAEVSTTWTPTFPQPMAGVMYALSKGEKGTGQMAESLEAAAVAAAPVITSGIDYDRLTAAIIAAGADQERSAKMDKLLAAFEQTIELQRANFNVPPASQPKAKFKDWFGVTLRMLAGDHPPASELKTLALEDVITGSDQVGLVPEVFTADYDDLISQDRPFLSSTREVRPPATGNTMTLPIITTRAGAGTQYGGEKTEITATAPKVGTGTWNAKSILAGADVSFQMILRADASFLDLLDQEFAEAYALDEEIKAIAALLAGYTDSASTSHNVQTGGVMDPEDPHFGVAFKNSVAACRRRPTHLWLSLNGMAAFIDAKAPVTNAPLYSTIAADITAGGGAGGRVSGLIPVYVPALDTSGVDVIIGPSRGFVWAEDPKIRLQADQPSIGGRDIVLAGTLFPAPRYADAFTTYTVAS